MSDSGQFLPDSWLAPADPGYAYGDVLPLRRKLDSTGKATGPLQLAIPNAVRGAVNDLALTVAAPGNALAGKYSDEDIKRIGPVMAGTLAGLGGAGLGSVPEGEVLGSFRGWHGTPYEFQPVEGNPWGKFDNKAIGSGEGAQVYGWGHYVAGARETAEQYKKQLSSGKYITPDGNTTDYSQLVLDAMDAVKTSHPTLHPDQVRGVVTNVMAAVDKGQPFGAYDFAGMSPQFQSAYKTAIAKTRGVQPAPGSLYHIQVRPDEHELLDWDKRLDQQSPQVQELVRPLIEKQLQRQYEALQNKPSPRHFNASALDYGSVRSSLLNAKGPEEIPAIAAQIPGSEIYKRIGLPAFDGNEGQVQASERLHNAGVPGIKYLDQFSRGKPDDPTATRNYVIFHPDNLKIVGRNGQESPVQLEQIDHDPFSGGGSSSPNE